MSHNSDCWISYDLAGTDQLLGILTLVRENNNKIDIKNNDYNTLKEKCLNSAINPSSKHE